MKTMNVLPHTDYTPTVESPPDPGFIPDSNEN